MQTCGNLCYDANKIDCHDFASTKSCNDKRAVDCHESLARFSQ
ncbi:hypothetical protein [Helicobacter sp. T3_23-1056]